MATGDAVELAKFGEYLANALTISDFAGGILASIIVTLLIVVPVALLTRGKNLNLIMMVGLLSIGFCVAVGWLAYWFLLIIVLGIALMFGNSMKKLITG